MGSTQGTDRDRESQSTVALNVLIPDSTLLSGNAQQGSLASCMSLHGSWATDGENCPLGLLVLLADIS